MSNTDLRTAITIIYIECVAPDEWESFRNTFATLIAKREMTLAQKWIDITHKRHKGVVQGLAETLMTNCDLLAINKVLKEVDNGSSS